MDDWVTEGARWLIRVLGVPGAHFYPRITRDQSEATPEQTENACRTLEAEGALTFDGARWWVRYVSAEHVPLGLAWIGLMQMRSLQEWAWRRHQGTAGLDAIAAALSNAARVGPGAEQRWLLEAHVRFVGLGEDPSRTELARRGADIVLLGLRSHMRVGGLGAGASPSERARRVKDIVLNDLPDEELQAALEPALTTLEAALSELRAGAAERAGERLAAAGDALARSIDPNGGTHAGDDDGAPSRPRTAEYLFRMRSDGTRIYMSSDPEIPAYVDHGAADPYHLYTRTWRLYMGGPDVMRLVRVNRVHTASGRWVETSAGRLFTGCRGTLPAGVPTSLSDGAPTWSYVGELDGRHEELERLRPADYVIVERGGCAMITAGRSASQRLRPFQIL